MIAETGKDYVTAARMNGASHLRLMFDEVLPNCTAPLIVQASLGISTAILDAAALGFLGLGAQPPAEPLARVERDNGRAPDVERFGNVDRHALQRHGIFVHGQSVERRAG